MLDLRFWASHQLTKCIGPYLFHSFLTFYITFKRATLASERLSDSSFVHTDRGNIFAYILLNAKNVATVPQQILRSIKMKSYLCDKNRWSGHLNMFYVG